MSNEISFPVIIGVAGYCDIAADAEPPIRLAVRALLEDWFGRYEGALHVLTALAGRADQIVVEEALELKISIIAVAPMPLTRYRNSLKNTAALDRHWDTADLRMILPDIQEIPAAEYVDRQKEQLGILLARRSHLLVALWDGIRDPDGRAGVGATVRMRLDGEHDDAVFLGSPMFKDANPLLNMTNRGPLLHIVTPQAGSTDADDGRRAGDCLLLGIPEQETALPTPVRSQEPVEPGNLYKALGPRLSQDFQQISRLNQQISKFKGPDARLLGIQLSYLNTDGLPPSAECAAAILKRLQAAADTAAQTYQGRLLGHFVPETSIRGMIAKARKVWRETGRRPQPGVVFCFALAIPVAVLSFEIYAHMRGGIVALLFYLAVLGTAAAFSAYRLADQEWQNRFQDYRALAEAMRVQLYWAVSALPAAVCDHYLSKQSGELGWIQFALRGPALWAAALSGTLDSPVRDAIKDGWIDDQKKYFERSAKLHERADKRGQTCAKFLLYAGVVMALILLLHECLLCIPGARGALGDMMLGQTHQYHELLLVLAATLPALAALFKVSRELRAYESHAHSYALMSRIFGRAAKVFEDATRLATAEQCDTEIKRLVRELGREALAENAEWLVDHRHRPIEHHPT